MRLSRLGLIAIVLGVVAGSFSFAVSRGSCAKATPRGANVGGKGSRAGVAAQLDPAPIQVLVTKLTLQSSRIMYRYTVVNGSAFPITGAVIGYDQFYGKPLLKGQPTGWDGDSIPSASYETPPGWVFAVEPTEEDSLTDIKWEISGTTGGIPGAESVGGFAVVVGQAEQAYDTGGLWVAYVRGELPFWGAIQSSGVTAVPISSVLARSDLKVGPNPARGSIEIQFAVPTTGPTTVDIFDVSGRRVKRVLNEKRAAGSSSAAWDGRDESGKEAAAGIYFVRVKTPTTQRFARVTWLRGGK